MLSKLKQKLQKEEYKRLLSNFISLSVLQGANYILPLITFPYLVRVLGVEKFGLLAFANATIAYFNILTDYGFNLTATREVSIYRDDKEKLIEIFSSVMTIKFILTILSLILLTILVFSFEKFRKDAIIYYLTFGIVIGQILFPQWFFQGMERMKYITFLNITAKIIFTIAIFVFIHKESDYWKVPLISSLGFIIAGILALYIIFKDFKIKFKIQSFPTIIYHLKEGWHIFISGIFTTIYTISTLFILGIFTNNIIVGYYSLAEKIVKAISGLFIPINSAIFPYISNLVNKSPEQAKFFLKRITLYSSLVIGILSIFVFVFSPEIIFLISGDVFSESVIILRILSFFPLIITIARIFSIDYLINFHYQNELSKIYFYSAILSLFFSFSLVPLFHAVGSALTVMFTELFATTYMYIIIKKRIL
ncbi:flippase [Caminibacter mediatlanticus TB-2]|uniref:Flippase n=1 Tax=Caminibacter mediatlanticus TB-2 TaxID=391592 RepID=A0ABX5V6S2_9BACT|nr:flippase [Caminibacter mediatlanticus]QCT93938.1 flippase [Caminibacter mediatlanticus TB-2]